MTDLELCSVEQAGLELRDVSACRVLGLKAHPLATTAILTSACEDPSSLPETQVSPWKPPFSMGHIQQIPMFHRSYLCNTFWIPGTLSVETLSYTSHPQAHPSRAAVLKISVAFLTQSFKTPFLVPLTTSFPQHTPSLLLQTLLLHLQQVSVLIRRPLPNVHVILSQSCMGHT